MVKFPGWGTVVRITQGKDDNKEEEDKKKSTKEVEDVLRNIRDMRALDRRKKELDTLHWGQTAKIEVDTDRGKRTITVADGPFIMFRDTVLKFSNGIYGWDPKTVSALSRFMERWQRAIEIGAERMVGECLAESRRWAVMIMAPSITPEDKHGDLYLYPFLPKGTSDKDKQKLME